jgi:hypothetical protein
MEINTDRIDDCVLALLCWVGTMVSAFGSRSSGLRWGDCTRKA